MIRIYLSGPITKNPDYNNSFSLLERTVKDKLSAYDKKTKRKHLWITVNPIKKTKPIKSKYEKKAEKEKKIFSFSDKDFYAEVITKCFNLINKCDIMIVSKDYLNIESRGATMEIFHAKALGIPIYQQFDNEHYAAIPNTVNKSRNQKKQKKMIETQKAFDWINQNPKKGSEK